MLVQGCRKNIGPFEACREKTVLPHRPLPPIRTAAGEGGEFLDMLRMTPNFSLLWAWPHQWIDNVRLSHHLREVF